MMLAAIVCHGQKPHRNDMVSLDSIFRPWSVPAYRWAVTYNPLGLGEWPAAAGLGDGRSRKGEGPLFTHGAADGVGDIAAEGLDLLHVATLHHDARQRFGARETHQHAA